MNETNKSDYVNFGDLVRKRLHRQCQYVSRYVGGLCDYPDLGEGLRFMERGKPVTYSDDYHSLEIHKDDAEEFIKRVKDYLNIIDPDVSTE